MFIGKSKIPIIEDIERIEVIRGPGATLWGANAVNGVINIITKNAKDTQGGQVSAWYGNHERGVGSVRYGGKINNDSYYRVYAKHNNYDEYQTANGIDANDEWRSSRSGFRMDSGKDDGDSYTLQGDAYSGQKDRPLSLPSLAGAGATSSVTVREVFEGANLLGRWGKKISDESETSLQIYYDYVSRKSRDQQVSGSDSSYRGYRFSAIHGVLMIEMK